MVLLLVVEYELTGHNLDLILFYSMRVVVHRVDCILLHGVRVLHLLRALPLLAAHDATLVELVQL